MIVEAYNDSIKRKLPKNQWNFQVTVKVSLSNIKDFLTQTLNCKLNDIDVEELGPNIFSISLNTIEVIQAMNMLSSQNKTMLRFGVL